MTELPSRPELLIRAFSGVRARPLRGSEGRYMCMTCTCAP